MWRAFWFIILVCGCTTMLEATETTSAPSAAPVEPGDQTRLARRIEPDLAGKTERLSQYINFFSRELGNDSRICAFDVKAESTRGKDIVLTGFVEFPETRTALNKFLTALGFKVTDQLEALPSQNLGDKLFGIVKAPHCFTFDRPSGRRKQENDCLLGEPLLLLREQDGHLLAHSHEGYLGYIPSKDVERLAEPAYVKYLDGPRVLVTKDHKRGANEVVPAGARIKLLNTEGDKVLAELPTGESLTLPADECRVLEIPAKKIDDIIATAQSLMGTPYFWGGRTSEGIDCSGLVQMSYASVGLVLPRDAYQQVFLGQLSATRWHRAGLRKGDTLYFLASDGKIRHTAIYLGDGKYLQAVMPKAKISSLNEGDPEYDAGHSKSFAFAKRLLD